MKFRRDSIALFGGFTELTSSSSVSALAPLTLEADSKTNRIARLGNYLLGRISHPCHHKSLDVRLMVFLDYLSAHRTARV
jgi:hypothetical protein